MKRGLEPAFPDSVAQQLSSITGPGIDTDPSIRDLTSLPWCSLDNDDSLDLDQLTACERTRSGTVKIFVAVADVDALVKKGSADERLVHHIGVHLGQGVRCCPRAPSTDLTSLNQDQDRLALVTEMVVA